MIIISSIHRALKSSQYLRLDHINLVHRLALIFKKLF